MNKAFLPPPKVPITGALDFVANKTNRTLIKTVSFMYRTIF
jgi:hypothetical protein